MDFTRYEQVPLIGQVGTAATLLDWTPSMFAGALAAGDVAAATEEITNVAALSGGVVLLHSVTVIDVADQGVALDIYLLQANQSIGAEDSAPDIDDTEVLDVLARIPVAAADYADLGGAKVATVGNLNRLVKCGAATTSLWAAIVNGAGTPTYAAGSLKIRFGFVRY